MCLAEAENVVFGGILNLCSTIFGPFRTTKSVKNGRWAAWAKFSRFRAQNVLKMVDGAGRGPEKLNTYGFFGRFGHSVASKKR